ncbi:hypothetical protein [Lapidilactobacillus wuchangensis]|uniref:hypothetical protein n=1 Tax=Lapidilactobacillus wuchangensis TaxID=2486001 RepID=UPI000F779C92|nr:hypothetical protein [Lapidilactobacillus wuchangensis]
MRRPNWKIVVISLIIVALGVGVTWRYQTVNAGSNQSIQEKRVYVNREYQTPALKFSFNRPTIKHQGNLVKVRVLFTIDQQTKLAYGDRPANLAFWENVRLEVPYGLSAIAHVVGINQQPVHLNQIKLGEQQLFQMSFQTTVTNWQRAQSVPRIIFMVPQKQSLVKYELFLNQELG